MSTAEAGRRPAGGEDTGASFSPQRGTSDELTAASAALSSSAIARAAAFPLAAYLSHARTGFRAAHEWVHYGVASRRAGLESLFASDGASEDTAGGTVFVLHCTRDAPDAAPHTAAASRPSTNAPAHGALARRPSGY